MWSQLEAEVTAPELSPAGAPDLLVAMAGLQAEGLPVAQVGGVSTNGNCLAHRRVLHLAARPALMPLEQLRLTTPLTPLPPLPPRRPRTRSI